MNIGESGTKLIQSFEQCKLDAYMPTKNDVWTIGWGHTGVEVIKGLSWTQDQADEAFRKDILWVETCINNNITAPITQNEFDALCSLIFNIGCPAFRGSTLLRLLNSADFDSAAQQFKKWNKQAGQELAGLTRRRGQEYNLFEQA